MSKEMRFTYFSYGTRYSFNPFKKVYDIRSGKQVDAVRIQLEEVNFRNDPNIYILDHTGKIFRG